MSVVVKRRARLASSGARAAYGVLDIGSNSIRLVVYEALTRAPMALFNERVQCGLGAGIDSTRRLDPDAIEPALGCLERFAHTANALGAGLLDVVGTAAIREAEDGADFVRLAKRRTGLDIRVISGIEEARLSALGAASAAPGLVGLVGDLGGASLELVEVVDGVPGQSSTLAVGPLRFKDADLKSARAVEAIERGFAPATWLGGMRGRSLHLVGGTWRALARLHMALKDYPLPIIHGHRLARTDAESLCRLVAGLSTKTMRKVASVPRRRQETLPFGAFVLGRLIARAQPSEVVFSAYGLREGLLYERLSAAERAADPLLAGGMEMSNRLGRGVEYGDALDLWLSEAFPAHEARDGLLRRVACLLADVSWRDHPDYRAEHAFHQVLRAPFVGLSHPERAFLAVAVSSRYRGASPGAEPIIEALLSPSRARVASGLGTALRIGALLSHGEPDLLQTARLSRNGDDKLRLTLRDVVEANFVRRLERLVEELASDLSIKHSEVRVGGPVDRSA